MSGSSVNGIALYKEKLTSAVLTCSRLRASLNFPLMCSEAFSIHVLLECNITEERCHAAHKRKKKITEAAKAARKPLWKIRNSSNTDLNPSYTEAWEKAEKPHQKNHGRGFILV